MAQHAVSAFVADGISQQPRLLLGPRVGPDDRRTHRLAVGIDEHRAHHLTGHDHTSDLFRPSATLCQERPRR